MIILSSLLSNTTSQASAFAQVQTVLILLVITLIVALISRRLQLVYTLVLVVVGFLIGFLSFLPQVHLDPNVVMFLFLPALLFEGAWSVEIEKLAADWLPVLLLAVAGVVVGIWVIALVFPLWKGVGLVLALPPVAPPSPTPPLSPLP